MKALAMTLTLLMAGSAHALVKIPGTFVPSQCGEQKYVSEAASELNPQIQEVCVGGVHGPGTQAVEFHFSDGTVKLFEVRSSSNLFVAIMNGNTKSNYYMVSEDGEEATMNAVQTRKGQIVSVSGKLGTVPFSVPEMSVVYTMY